MHSDNKGSSFRVPGEREEEHVAARELAYEASEDSRDAGEQIIVVVVVLAITPMGGGGVPIGRGLCVAIV